MWGWAGACRCVRARACARAAALISLFFRNVGGELRDSAPGKFWGFRVHSHGGGSRVLGRGARNCALCRNCVTRTVSGVYRN